MGMLGPHLNWNSDLSFRKGAHDGLRMPRVEVRCPHPCPEATGVTIQVSSPCYWCPMVSNRQIHKDLGVPLFANHIRALTASFDSKIADMGNPLVRQLSRYLRWPRVDPVTWRKNQWRQGPAGQSRPSPLMAKPTKWITFGTDQPRISKWQSKKESWTKNFQTHCKEQK